MDLGTREWSRRRYFAAVAFVFILGVLAVVSGVLGLQKPWDVESVKSLFGVFGGVVCLVVTALGLWAITGSAENAPPE